MARAALFMAFQAKQKHRLQFLAALSPQITTSSDGMTYGDIHDEERQQPRGQPCDVSLTLSQFVGVHVAYYWRLRMKVALRPRLRLVIEWLIALPLGHGFFAIIKSQGNSIPCYFTGGRRNHHHGPCLTTSNCARRHSFLAYDPTGATRACYSVSRDTFLSCNRLLDGSDNEDNGNHHDHLDHSTMPEDRDWELERRGLPMIHVVCMKSEENCP